MTKTHFASPLVVLSILVTSLASCNLPQPKSEPSPTLSVTQAYQTVQARLTESAIQNPRPTPGPITPSATTEVPSPTVPTTPAVTESPPATQTPPYASPTKVCDQAAAGNPIDVTIPDDTKLEPGKPFTKTWRLVNAGSCPWTQEYTVDFFSGEAMTTATSVPLPGRVEPGQSIDISLDMTTPQRSGTYQSNWKLRNVADTWFGIGPNGSAPFWVRIVVTGTVTGTITATSTITATPNGTITATPGETVTPTATSTSTETTETGVRTSGSNSLAANDRLDLDDDDVNGDGSDLMFNLTPEGMHALSPVGGASLAPFALRPPEPLECQGIEWSGSGLRLEDYPAGIYLCYRTDEGRFGWLSYEAVDSSGSSLLVEYLTWELP